MSQPDLPRGPRPLDPRPQPDRPPENGRPLPDFRQEGSARSPEDLLDRLRDRLDRLAANHPSALPADADRTGHGWPVSERAEPASPATEHAEHPGLGDRRDEFNGDVPVDPAAAESESADRAAADWKLADPAAGGGELVDPELAGAGLAGWGDFFGDWGAGELELGLGGGEPYRPWFMGGERLAPWFTDDLGE